MSAYVMSMYVYKMHILCTVTNRFCAISAMSGKQIF